jgi:sugar phosphate isomerase/epimerase
MCYGYDGQQAIEETLGQQGMEPRRISRRGLLAGSGAGAAALAMGALAPATASTASAQASGRRLPLGQISIQLYTLRDDLEDNYRRTLRYVADIGYRQVEQAGYYGQTAKQVKRFHDRIGIDTTSSHDNPSENRAALETKIANALTLEQQYMVVPYLRSDDPDQWRAWAWQMNSEAYAARRAGLRYGYHNHAHEFLTLATGERPWDILSTELEPSLVHFEVDLYWVVTGGIESGDGLGDPTGFAVETINEATLKVRQYHVKDRDPETGDMCDLGTGMIDFPRIFRAHRVEEYIVENDTPDVTPRRTAQVGFDYLRDLRF